MPSLPNASWVSFGRRVGAPDQHVADHVVEPHQRRFELFRLYPGKLEAELQRLKLLGRDADPLRRVVEGVELFEDLGALADQLGEADDDGADRAGDAEADRPEP